MTADGTRARTPAPTLVAVDGPAGSGKSTVARAVARRLGLRYVDTGAMYRAITLAALQAGVALDDAPALTALAESAPLELVTDPEQPSVRLGEVDVSARVRDADVTAAVSAVSAVPGVRAALVRRQRELAGAAGAVVEGRDIGTVVLPDAPVKIFLTASEQARADRRALQDATDVAATAADLSRRDRLDSTRATSPLTPATNATVIDSTHLGVDAVVDAIVAQVEGTPTVSQKVQPSTQGRGFSGPNAQVDRFKPWMYFGLRRPARWLLRLLFRIQVEGLENVPAAGPVLIAGNHAGLLDGPLVVIFNRRVVRVLSKVELFKGRFGDFLLAAGQIPVRRGQADRAALRACTRVLADGGVLAVFPEGTRGAANLDSVRDGAAYVLVRAGVEGRSRIPIVPVVCHGTAAAFPRGAKRPKLRAPIRIVFGSPFTVELPADPHARKGIAATAEQIRLGLLAHLENDRG
ncbi:MAG TPA: (d)CMP kinase [Mycobacteriales bacterium]|nr:(d)CMP kinase [Mycobacteriales bacterium]